MKITPEQLTRIQELHGAAHGKLRELGLALKDLGMAEDGTISEVLRCDPTLSRRVLKSAWAVVEYLLHPDLANMSPVAVEFLKNRPLEAQAEMIHKKVKFGKKQVPFPQLTGSQFHKAVRRGPFGTIRILPESERKTWPKKPTLQALDTGLKIGNYFYTFTEICVLPDSFFKKLDTARRQHGASQKESQAKIKKVAHMAKAVL